MRNEYRSIEVTAPAVEIAGLGSAWDGARIAHLTDIHVGRHISVGDVGRMVELCNSLRPDIVVLTGDYLDHRETVSPALAGALGRLRAEHGVFAVLGNHDHYAGAEHVAGMLLAAGVSLLRDESRILDRGGQKLCVAGAEELWSGYQDVAAALAGVDPAVPRILLCHNPDAAEVLPPLRVDLMLSGHTHGGQIMLPIVGPPALPIRHRKYLMGLVRGPRCQVYISRGLGVAGLPLRLNCRPELPVITLRRA